MRFLITLLFLSILFLLCACNTGQRLGQAEVFTWGDQPISFSPPLTLWKRSREQSGGREGVAFIKSRGGGTMIRVAEHFRVGKRDKCNEIQEILDGVSQNNWGEREFIIRTQRARPYASPAYNEEEPELVDQANRYIDQSRKEYKNDNFAGVENALTKALKSLSQIKFSLENVIDLVMFADDGKKDMAQLEVSDPVSIKVGGEDATQIDYQFYEDWRKTTFYKREVYVAHNNRLFVLDYIGSKRDKKVFDKVVKSISFPEGDCVH